MRTIKELTVFFNRQDNLTHATITAEEFNMILNAPPHVKKTFKVATFYTMYKTLNIPACDIEEAMKLAEEWEFDLKTGDYMDDSFMIDVEATKELNNL